MKKKNFKVRAVVDCSVFESLTMLDADGEKVCWNTTNVFSVMEKAGFDNEIIDGVTIEISFRVIAGPAEPGTQKEQ